MNDERDIRRRLPDAAEVGYWTAEDGGRIRTLRLRADSRAKGAVLFAGGRADFFEKYLESLMHWHSRGWDVTAFDWRGQGGSLDIMADAAKTAVRYPRVGHIDDFALWVKDLAGFSADWRAAVAGPHMLIGHSMGGHLMLRHVAAHAAEHTPPAAALVLSSPMIGFRTPLPEALVRRITAARVRGGQAMRYAWGQGAPPTAAKSLRQRRLTGDLERYADELWWNARNPDHVLGGASWGWIDAAYRSIDLLAASGIPESIGLPVLLAAAAKDRVVDTTRAVALIRRIPHHEIALFAGGHELLRERDDIRHAIWERIDRFMEEHV